MNKSYSELIKLKTFDERYEYLKLSSRVGEETFGVERQINQSFYKSPRWRSVRKEILIRDWLQDIGLDGFPILLPDVAIVHHINPITLDDIINDNECLYDPENLITVSSSTHNDIHFGKDRELGESYLVERKPNDTNPWRK